MGKDRALTILFFMILAASVACFFKAMIFVYDCVELEVKGQTAIGYVDAFEKKGRGKYREIISFKSENGNCKLFGFKNVELNSTLGKQYPIVYINNKCESAKIDNVGYFVIEASAYLIGCVIYGLMALKWNKKIRPWLEKWFT